MTHGHEDHVGALPYLLADLNVPIYCTTLTHGLVSVKLKERGLLRDAELHIVKPEDRIKLGHFEIEFFRVSHSIPDAVGLIMHTPAGIIVHTGDFKFDGAPVGSSITDYDKLVDLGRRDVLALLCDCVRVELPGRTPPERVVGETFDKVVSSATGRVIITTFASNVSRIQQVIDTACKYNRKVAVVGRSLEKNVEVAGQLGFLTVSDGTLVTVNQARSLPPEEVILITTGSQGEPTSVLSRIATNGHHRIRIIPGDTVIISATPVPGNEETVARTIDNLFKLGASVIYDAIMMVHVSGHASRDELSQMLGLVQPRYCVPLHGEYRHMVLFKRLAEEAGIPAANVIISEVGDVIEFGEDYGRLAHRIPVGEVLVDGVVMGEAAQDVLKDRQHLSKEGIVIVVVALDRRDGHIVSGPDIVSRGFVYLRESDAMMEEAQQVIRKALESAPDDLLEYGFAVQCIKNALGKFIFERTRRRPMILPVVTEL
ncbi:MAG: ribonuclease J [Chloroflexi bacterium]|nr:ribonuclease J [Chloroflexota bacterium]